MFSPPPEVKPQNTSIARKNHYRKRKKLFMKRKKEWLNKQKTFGSKLAVTMSSWAHNFNVIANWQMKHQLAFYKAKAKSLDYENKILHGVIRKYHMNPEVPAESSSSESEEETSEVIPENHSAENHSAEDFEVSDEFIAFLRANATFREDARKERERFKGQPSAEENSVEQLEVTPTQTHEEEVAKYKELYGDKWQKIVALEMAAQSTFIQESDKDNTVYWPNIPLNL